MHTFLVDVSPIKGSLKRSLPNVQVRDPGSCYGIAPMGFAQEECLASPATALDII